MNRKQISRFKMYQGTTEFCDKNTLIVSPLPNFSTNLSSLKTHSDALHLIAQQQSGDSSGTTLVKNDDRKTIVTLGSDIARKLAAFAKLTNNQKLLKDIDYSESDLKHLTDTILPDTAKLIHDRAEENLTALADYQISNRSLDSLLQAINNFKQSALSPLAEKINNTQTTTRLKQLFASGDKLLADMDTAVEIIKLTQPDFYAGYKLARRVIEMGSGKRTLKATVTDESTSQPIAGVTVSFWTADTAAKTLAQGDAILTKKTAKKGSFYVSSLAAGTYTVTVKKSGYTEQTLTIFVNEGEQTKVDVKLAKA